MHHVIYHSGAPNEKLMKACERYLNALDVGQSTGESAKTLISELEAAASAKPKITGTNNMTEIQSSIQEILEH